MTKARCKHCDHKKLENVYHEQGCEDNHREHVHRKCLKCQNAYTVVPSDVQH